MATLLYTIVGITIGSSLHCAVRREISPCTCNPHDMFPNTIQVTCERMQSFNQIVDVLHDKFSADSDIWLRITHSYLSDFDERSFKEMNMNVRNLRLNFNNLSFLPPSTFRNLDKVDYFSLSDNAFEEIPRDIFSHMPNLGTLDLGRMRLRTVRTDDFNNFVNLRHLILAMNHIETLEKNSIPHTIENFHIGRNNISSLNGTLKYLNELKLLMIHCNNISDLEDELPYSPGLIMILASQNHIKKLPKMIKNYVNLNAFYIDSNEIESLDGVFSYAKKLQLIWAHNNKIQYLAKDEFLEATSIDEIQLSGNQIKSLNQSLLYMKSLREANFSHNLMTEFSLQEVIGLRKLRLLDLSNNLIDHLHGGLGNTVSGGCMLKELHLEHNLLKSLNGALAGLGNLRKLYLSNNRIDAITAEDFDKMEELEKLDLSFNNIKSLEEFSKVFLPSLEMLNASYNQLTTMRNDFHGLPVMCLADLSHNMITSFTTELVSNTRCSNHGVPNKLEILLQENPILCDKKIVQLVYEMEMFSTRLTGFAHCIVPQDSTILLHSQIPSIPLIPQIINQQMPLIPNQIPIVQIIIPTPIKTANIFDEANNNNDHDHVERIEIEDKNEAPPNMRLPNTTETSTVAYQIPEIVSEHPTSPLMSVLSGNLPISNATGDINDTHNETQAKNSSDEKSSFTYNELEDTVDVSDANSEQMNNKLPNVIEQMQPEPSVPNNEKPPPPPELHSNFK